MMASRLSNGPSRQDVRKKRRMKAGQGQDAGSHDVGRSGGSAPKYIDLTRYQMFCWKVMGGAVVRRAKLDSRLELQLQQAHVRMRAEEYTAYVWTTVLLVLLSSLAIGLLLAIAMLSMLQAPAEIVMMVSVLIIPLPPAITLGMLMAMPSIKAKERGRDIDKRIGPAMSFISAMASADVNIDVIFKELARQDIYGEIKNEAEWIARDNELLGFDILTAIGRAAQRTPSVKFQEFLQGVVTTSTSGGRLKPYFLQKAEQFEKEGKLAMRSQLETIGLMAETFVTVVVAFPLFLVVIMAIMAIIPGGGSPALTMFLLEVVIVVIVPFSQFGFIFLIWNTTKESSF